MRLQLLIAIICVLSHLVLNGKFMTLSYCFGSLIIEDVVVNVTYPELHQRFPLPVYMFAFEQNLSANCISRSAAIFNRKTASCLGSMACIFSSKTAYRCPVHPFTL